MRRSRHVSMIGLLVPMLITAAAVWPGRLPPPAGAQPQAEVEALQRSLVGLDPQAREQRLLDGARREGNQVVVYITWNERQSQNVAARFERRYAGLQVRVLRAGSGEIANRILTEGRAGRSTWDVAEANSGFVPLLRTAGLLSRYTGFSRNGINQRFLDPQGWWTGVLLEPVVLAWNTEKVPPGKAPRTYEDLTRPEWRGNFSLDTEDYEFFEYVLATRGRDKGMALMRALAANKPRMVRGRTPQTQLLLAGEFAASAVLFDYRAVDNKEKGAPIDFTYVEPVFVDISPLLIARSPVHPSGALLFMDWIISREGQQVIADEGRTPVRSDVRLRYEQLKKPFGMRLYIRMAGEAGTDHNTLIQEFNRLFGLTR